MANNKGSGAKQASELEKAQQKTKSELNVRIDKLVNDPNSSIKAFASVNLGDGYAVHGLKIMDSKKGLFVQMPSRPYKTANGETKYEDIFHPVTAESRTALIDAVNDAYKQALEQQQSGQGDSEKKSNMSGDNPAHVQAM